MTEIYLLKVYCGQKSYPQCHLVVSCSTAEQLVVQKCSHFRKCLLTVRTTSTQTTLEPPAEMDWSKVRSGQLRCQSTLDLLLRLLNEIQFVLLRNSLLSAVCARSKLACQCEHHMVKSLWSVRSGSVCKVWLQRVRVLLHQPSLMS